MTVASDKIFDVEELPANHLLHARPRAILLQYGFIALTEESMAIRVYKEMGMAALSRVQHTACVP